MTNTLNNKKSTKQRVTLFLKPEIIKQAKAEAVLADLTVTQLIEAALIKYLPKETIIRKVEA